MHDRFADITWPRREGRRDFERLLADDASVVLVARDGTEVIGLLVGDASASSSTRRPVTFAVLRSMYVDGARRGQGAGHLLITAFVSWARDRGCAEVHRHEPGASAGPVTRRVRNSRHEIAAHTAIATSHTMAWSTT